MSAIHPKADLAECNSHVRFVPITDISRVIRSPRDTTESGENNVRYEKFRTSYLCPIAK
jgi:hypothetical protein